MPSPTRPRVIAAGMIGNLLEWYDFGIYGYFAPSIGRVFFPTTDAVAQVLAAFGVFAVGYLMRPLGGALIGYIGDRHGRRAALIFSIATMAAPTFLVGLLPGYATLGLLAPVLLTLLRVLQGLSVGGEWPTSFIFMIEQGPSNRRGLLGAVTSCGGLVGILTGSGIGALLTDMLPQGELDAWGWRLPFLFGLVAGITGLVLRRGIRDVRQPGEVPAASPLLETLRDHGWLVARLAGVAAFSAVGFYLMFLYVVDWLQTVDGEPPARALAINTASMVAMIPVELLAGWLSDRLGRRPVMLSALALAFVAALPLFWLMHHPGTIEVLVGQLGFVVLIGTILATQPALMVEVTPPGLRCTTIALGYNISVGVMGGLTPLAATWLVHRTDMDLSPAVMLMAVAALSFVAVLSFRTVAKT